VGNSCQLILWIGSRYMLLCSNYFASSADNADRLGYNPASYYSQLATTTQDGRMSAADKVKLDKYDSVMGVFTPVLYTYDHSTYQDVLVSGLSSIGSITGEYCRVGNLCYITIRLSCNSGNLSLTSNNNILGVKGLPFVAKSRSILEFAEEGMTSFVNYTMGNSNAVAVKNELIYGEVGKDTNYVWLRSKASPDFYYANTVTLGRGTVSITQLDVTIQGCYFIK